MRGPAADATAQRGVLDHVPGPTTVAASHPEIVTHVIEEAARATR
ncbi:hypothetical protein AB0C76_20195 [Kitasatospora sp. NPDC048722]